MSAEIAIGTITPSGNRTVERVTQTLCAALGSVVPLFTRIPVHGATSPTASPSGPYDWAAMDSAASLLAHADPQAICWNGSKGGDYGFDVDHTLCHRLRTLTGRPVVTSALAVLSILDALSVRRIALVTPYIASVHARAAEGFSGKGYEIAGECFAGISDNLAYGAIPPEDVAAMGRQALAGSRAQAVVFFCTNLHGAPARATLEAESGLPAVDSTAAGAWAVLRAAGADTTPLSPFGRLFTL